MQIHTCGYCRMRHGQAPCQVEVKEEGLEGFVPASWIVQVFAADGSLRPDAEVAADGAAVEVRPDFRAYLEAGKPERFQSRRPFISRRDEAFNVVPHLPEARGLADLYGEPVAV